MLTVGLFIFFFFFCVFLLYHFLRDNLQHIPRLITLAHAHTSLQILPVPNASVNTFRCSCQQ